MIKLQDSTPAIYYDKSRDFQLMGRLYDVVFNHIKTNSANLYNLPIGKNMDEKLLTLLGFTLGFQSKHKYNSTQLAAICSVLPQILREKGSLQAIITAVNAMLSAEGIKQALDYTVVNKRYIVLYLPQQLSDLTLLKDLLIYILPAGLGCELVKEISVNVKVETILETEDEVTWYMDKAENLGQVLQVGNAEVRASMVDGSIKDSPGILQNTTISPAHTWDSRPGETKLSAPEIAINGTELSFDEIEDADSYSIYVDGTKAGEIVPNGGN